MYALCSILTSISYRRAI